MKIYLFRHGQTIWNSEKRVQGHIDIPLSERGVEQAEIVSEKIKDIPFEAAFSSTMERAVVTAEVLLSKTERKPVLYQDERLMELGFGEEEGTRFDRAYEDESDPLHNFIVAPDKYIPPEGGESIDDGWERARAFFEERVIPLERELPPDANILIVSHGGLIRAITCNISGRPYSQFWGDRFMKNLAMNILEVKDGKITLIEEALDMLKED